jgi:hypothetical protein
MKKILLVTCSLVILKMGYSQSNDVGAGNSMTFNGNTGNYVSLGDVYNSQLFPVTVEAWINPVAYSATSSGIFATDDDTAIDAGFYVMLNPSGQLEVEFGNGLGTGNSFHRGYISDVPVKLNKWSHILVQCKSVTDVTLYINGVPRTKIASSGTSTQTAMVHTAAPAVIGKKSGSLGESTFNGQIDEIRLWNNFRGQSSIRQTMCRKILPTSEHLIGYWNVNEAVTSSTIIDLTTPAESGTVVGTIGKIISSAPIGDDSKYRYESNWFEVELTLQVSPTNKERIKVQDIHGDGIQLYRVDATPVYTDGLNTIPPYYFGIFGIEGASAASYNYRYIYTVDYGFATNTNEADLVLMARNDATVPAWVNDNGILQTNLNWITKHDGITTRVECILNLPGGLKSTEENFVAVNDDAVSIYPNPVQGMIYLELADAGASILSVRLIDEMGKVMKVINGMDQQSPLALNISDVPNGIYFAEVISTSGRSMEKILVQK